MATTIIRAGIGHAADDLASEAHLRFFEVRQPHAEPGPSVPELSPASIMLTKMLSKTLGCLRVALARLEPSFTSCRTCARMTLSLLVFGLIHQRVERFDQRDIGFDQAGELAGHERRPRRRLTRPPKKGISPELDGLAAVFSMISRDHEALFLELLASGFLVLGLDHALAGSFLRARSAL